MYFDNYPTVTVTSDNEEQNIYSITPNFYFIDQPIVKVNGTKKTVSKKLMIWFDIKNEHDRRFDYHNVNKQIVLEDFSWQLYKTKFNEEKQEVEKVKLSPGKEKDGIVEFKKLLIDGKPNNPIIYELDADQDDWNFEYSLNYKNRQRVGLTKDGVSGTNKGNIEIKKCGDKYVFNNAFSFNNNSDFPIWIINRDQLRIQKSDLNQLDDKNKALAQIYVDHSEESSKKNTVNEQIRAELDAIANKGISYLQVSEKAFKLTKNDKLYTLRKASGDRFDFKAGKWIEDKDSNQIYFDKNDLKLNFKFNNRDVSIDWKINEVNNVIQRHGKSKLNLTKYISYSDLKPNTKFEAFLDSRNAKLWK